MKNNSISRSA